MKVIKVVLSTGKVITVPDRRDTITQADLRNTGNASKRQVKNRSGRAARKQHNGRRALQAVGGYADGTKAIYAPADEPLCRVRTTTASDHRLRAADQQLLGLYPSRREFTTDLGGSCSTGYIGGRGA